MTFGTYRMTFGTYRMTFGTYRTACGTYRQSGGWLFPARDRVGAGWRSTRGQKK